MKAAYADPPYLNCGKLYKKHHPEAMVWDDPQAHARLAAQLHEQYDAWALSCSTPSLQTLLPLMPQGIRVAAWVKPFAVFKPGVGVAYAWEPVIFKEGRKRPRTQPTARDWVSANITLRKGLTGAKPVQFCDWLFDLLTLHPDDEFTDLFPGTGIVTQAWDEWRSRNRPQLTMEQWQLMGGISEATDKQELLLAEGDFIGAAEKRREAEDNEQKLSKARKVRAR